MKRYLLLEDGTTYEGTGYGYEGETNGEIVFTTSMSGYLETEFNIDNNIIARAMELDRVYIGSRYPDYYTEGSPFEYYSIEDEKRCLNYAKEIFEFCSKNIRD